MVRYSSKETSNNDKWIIVFAAFMCFMITYGFLLSSGIFLVYFVDHFEASKGDIAWIGALANACNFLSDPLSSILTKRYGFRVTVIIGSITTSAIIILSSFMTTIDSLIFTYALIGIASSLITFPSTLCVLLHYNSKRSLALGLAYTGVGVGNFVLAPLTHFLLDLYHYNGIMIIYGALVLNCAAFGGLLRPLRLKVQHEEVIHDENFRAQNKMLILKENELPVDNSEVQAEINHDSNSSLKKSLCFNCLNCQMTFFSKIFQLIGNVVALQHLKNVKFLLLAIGQLFGFMCYIVPFTYIVHASILKGIHENKAVFLLSIMAVSGTVSRPILGFIKNSSKISTLMLHNVCLCISAFLIIITPVYSTYTEIAISMAIIGFTNNALIVLVPIILVDFVGISHVNEAFGLLGIFKGISWMLTPPFTGYLFDLTGNYNTTFYVGGAGVIFYTMLVSLSPRISKYFHKLDKANSISLDSAT